MQHRLARRGAETGWDVDQVPAQGSAAGDSVIAAGQCCGGAQQVMGDGRAGQPGAIGGKQPRWDMSQWAVDEVGEGGFDDGVGGG